MANSSEQVPPLQGREERTENYREKRRELAMSLAKETIDQFFAERYRMRQFLSDDVSIIEVVPPYDRNRYREVKQQGLVPEQVRREARAIILDFFGVDPEKIREVFNSLAQLGKTERGQEIPTRIDGVSYLVNFNPDPKEPATENDRLAVRPPQQLGA